MKTVLAALALLAWPWAAQAYDNIESCVQSYQVLARTPLECPAFMDRMKSAMANCPLSNSIDHVLYGLATATRASNLPDQQAADFLILFIQARRCDAADLR